MYHVVIEKYDNLLTPQRMNIKFNYLYRDAANYKVFGSLIFSNPDGLNLLEIEARIREELIDGQFFDPDKWSIPRLQFEKWESEFDHEWNEFEGVEETEEESSQPMSINQFLQKLKLSRIKNTL
jgi:hypothetical protein